MMWILDMNIREPPQTKSQNAVILLILGNVKWSVPAGSGRRTDGTVIESQCKGPSPLGFHSIVLDQTFRIVDFKLVVVVGEDKESQWRSIDETH